MSARDELDLRLAAWMTETASGPPPAGRFEQAMDVTARRRPRPRWFAAFGSDWVGTTAAGRVGWAWPRLRRELLVAAVVALLVAALIGIQALGLLGVGGPGRTQTHGPSAAAVPLPTAGAIAPGTYFAANPYVDDNPVRSCARGCADYQRIILTLPAGWATSDGLVYKHLNQPGEVAFSAWTVDQVYADPCHWRGSTLSPLDLAGHSHDASGFVLAPEVGGLANQALRGPRPRALAEVTLGGQTTLRIDLSVPADLDMSTCDMGQFRSWSEWDVVDGANSHNAPGQLDTVYMVDVDRRPLVIDASHMPATSREDLAELGAILASMIVDRGPVETPSPASPTATPTAPPGFELPTSEVRVGRLNPGSYEYLDVDGQGFNVRFTVPAGWTWDGRYLSKGDVGPPGGAAIFFFGGPVQAYADPCGWAATQMTAPTGLEVYDLMAALAVQPMRGATTPIDRPANVPGLANRWAGNAIELNVPGDINFADCDQGHFRSWGPEKNARVHQGPGQHDLVWTVYVSGVGGSPGGLVIDAASFPGTPADVMSEIEAILGSIAVGHWG